MTTFTFAAGYDAVEYLEAYGQIYLDAVQTAVRQKKDPQTIYREVLAAVGEHRQPLALRCKQAAAYLIELEAR